MTMHVIGEDNKNDKKMVVRDDTSNQPIPSPFNDDDFDENGYYKGKKKSDD